MRGRRLHVIVLTIVYECISERLDKVHEAVFRYILFKIVSDPAYTCDKRLHYCHV